LEFALFDHLDLFRISEFEFRVYLLGAPLDFGQDLLWAFAH